MGCFLACFGFTKKKKHRKPGTKNGPGERDNGSYMPLDSHVPVEFDAAGEKIASDSELQSANEEKPKETSILKTKKKVRFNLNVKAYEPIPNEDDTSSFFWEGDEEKKSEFNKETTSMNSLSYEEDSIASTMGSYPPSYRYQNCRDGYDNEDDELIFEEHDLNFEDIEDSDEEKNGYSNESDDETPSQEDFPWKLNSVDEVVTDQMPGERKSSFEQLPDLQNKDLQKLESIHARDRSQYVFSVLNPVENLTQWKAIKARAARLKHQKENIMLEQEEQNPLSTKLNSDSFAKLRETQMFL